MIKKSLLFCSALILAVLLWHGVPLPQWLWRPVLQSLELSPDYSVQIERVVVSVIPSPKIRFINTDITLKPEPTHHLRVAYTRVDLPWLQLFGHNESPLNIVVKGAFIPMQQDAEGQWSWVNLLKSKNDLSGTKRLKILTVSDSHIQIGANQLSPQLQGELTIDQLFVDPTGDMESSLGLRWQSPLETTPVTVQATTLVQSMVHHNNPYWVLNRIQSDIKGPWDGYPWLATLGMDQLWVSQLAPLSASGSGFKSYLRRDDDPDQHQAALTVQQMSMVLPDGRLNLNHAEWTYTANDAQAWSFNAVLDGATHQLSFTPATIEGSESKPAPPSTWSVPCNGIARTTGNAWTWQNGWFIKRSTNRKNAGNGLTWLMCQ